MEPRIARISTDLQLFSSGLRLEGLEERELCVRFITQGVALRLVTTALQALYCNLLVRHGDLKSRL